MTSHNFQEKLTPSPFRHASSRYSGPPSNMTSQTSTPAPAACSVVYRDEFQRI